VIDRLAALRSALGQGEEPPAGSDLEVVHGAGGEVEHVRVTLTAPLDVEELARRFGPASLLPRLPAGGRRALFRETSPGDGERSATVLAELDGSGKARAVILRLDDLR
jgi:hypothetical protein